MLGVRQRHVDDLGALVEAVLDRTGYRRELESSSDPQDLARLDNLNELVSVAHEFTTDRENAAALDELTDTADDEDVPDTGVLAEFLERVSLVADADDVPEHSAGVVTLMTLHTAKGLEFPVVFVTGWEDGMFPHMRSLDDPVELSEERRLAYVGLTRARKLAVVSYTANRRLYAQWQSSIPSRFVDELPEAHVERAGSAAMQREARMVAAPSVFTGGPLVARRARQVEEWELPVRPPRADRIAVGARVFHQKFGYGRVLAVDDDRLEIAFEQAGQKRLLDRFVEKA